MSRQIVFTLYQVNMLCRLTVMLIDIALAIASVCAVAMQKIM